MSGKVLAEEAGSTLNPFLGRNVQANLPGQNQSRRVGCTLRKNSNSRKNLIPRRK
jgi:hypothetical protein